MGALLEQRSHPEYYSNDNNTHHSRVRQHLRRGTRKRRQANELCRECDGSHTNRLHTVSNALQHYITHGVTPYHTQRQHLTTAPSSLSDRRRNPTKSLTGLQTDLISLCILLLQCS